jgi:PPOX class probable F420-dependent enzyme
MTRDEALAFLATGTRTGKVATVRPNGMPHVAPVWFVVQRDEILFTTWHTTVKARNLTADARAALTVDLEEPPYAFVLVEGEVRIGRNDPDLLETATAIGARYMGADVAEEFGRRNAVEGEWLMRLPITRIVAKHEMTA